MALESCVLIDVKLILNCAHYQLHVANSKDHDITRAFTQKVKCPRWRKSTTDCEQTIRLQWLQSASHRHTFKDIACYFSIPMLIMTISAHAQVICWQQFKLLCRVTCRTESHTPSIWTAEKTIKERFVLLCNFEPSFKRNVIMPAQSSARRGKTCQDRAQPLNSKALRIHAYWSHPKHYKSLHVCAWSPPTGAENYCAGCKGTKFFARIL